MSLMKKGYPLPSTESGQIGWTMGLWLILFLGILLCACIQVDAYRSAAQYMEDALAASNLAAAVIDIEEYGISHEVRVADPTEAYSLYREAMRINLGLDENWNCANRTVIGGPVQVESFIVYNVCGNEVDVCAFDGSGGMDRYRARLGEVFAPTGEAVEFTGIYSQISCKIAGLFGMEVPARKGKLVDVARNPDDPKQSMDEKAAETAE